MKRRECIQSVNVTAYVTEDLPCPERAVFERHLGGCESCRCAVEEAGRVVAFLKSDPDREVTRDLAPLVLSRTKTGRRAGAYWRWPLAAAAALLLLMGGIWRPWRAADGDIGVVKQKAVPAPADPAGAALEWLCATQEADGSWSTKRWGGRPQFEVALTGLSLMALLEAGDTSEKVRAAVERAVDYLVSKQDEGGSFGPAFDGEPYNRGIAALALARAFELRQDELLRVVLDRAIKRIGERQNRDGGWGYENTADSASNLSITLWQIEALRLAGRLGWAQAAVKTQRGLSWMTRMVAVDGAFGYRREGDHPEGSQTLTAMGAMSLIDGAHAGLLSPERSNAIRAQVRKLAAAGGPDMDYYRRYFLAAALRKMGEDAEAGTLVSMRKALAARQVGTGRERGSWPPDDRWSAAGGRVYATALAALSFR